MRRILTRAGSIYLSGQPSPATTAGGTDPVLAHPRSRQWPSSPAGRLRSACPPSASPPPASSRGLPWPRCGRGRSRRWLSSPIGRFTVTALADGFADMPFSFFTGREPKEIEAAATALSAARSSGIRLVFNQYLIDDGERLILVDTGPAGAVGRTGQLPMALDTLGVRLDQIGAVVVTHMHLDHTGGLIAGGRRNFPAADVYVDRREVAHWTDPAKRAAAPDFLQSSFDAAAEVVRLYPRLQATDGERQIARGVSLVDLTGHTPGHIGVRVEDGGRERADGVGHALPSLAPPRLLGHWLRVRAGPGRSTGDAGTLLPAGRGGEGAR